MQNFEDFGINLNGETGQIKTTCPNCSAHRKKKTEPCLSVNTELGVAKCHNCGFAVNIKGYQMQENFVKKPHSIPDYHYEESQGLYDYFKARGISPETLRANKVGASPDGDGIMFPYIKDKVVNVKYRSFDKSKFRLAKGAEICMYGIQNLFMDGFLATKKVFIVEGEVDALSLYEVGFPFVLSVPNGACVEEEGCAPITPRFEFLEDPDIAIILGEVDEIVLATDMDYKGRRLADELSKRLGQERCSKVEFPAGMKDANDVLVSLGKDALVEAMLSAKPMVTGLVSIKDLKDSATDFYEHGLEAGMPCGIDSLDGVYTLQLGLLTLVTGIPEIGKSTVLDNMLVGYAKENGLKVAYFSPETKPVQFHVARLASIHNGQKFGTPDDDDRMSYKEYSDSLDWLNDHFHFIQPKKNTLEEILTLAKVSVLQHGTNILVIDPYSRIVMDSDVEHRFIRNMLNELSEFGNKYNVHIFVVAHPTKLEPAGRSSNPQQMKDYPVVTPYNIKGACYSADTEYLSKSGWKLHQEWDGEEVAVFDDAGNMSWEVPSRLNSYLHDGPMVSIKSKNQDILVTDNHRMWVMDGWTGKWNFRDAGSLPKANLFFRYAVEKPDEGGFPASVRTDAAWLLGMYVAEGWNSHGGASIAQAEGHVNDALATCLQGLGLKYSEKVSHRPDKNEKPLHTYRIKRRGQEMYCDFLQSCGDKSRNKRLPDFVWEWSRMSKLSLLRGLIDGDGCRKGEHYSYTTTSRGLAEDVQRLCLELGLGSVCTPDSRNGISEYTRDRWNISISPFSRKTVSIRPSRHVRTVPYAGPVFCFTVPSGKYITRRNGRIAFHGNSEWFNSSDFILSLWRTRQVPNAPVKIHVLKSKYHHIAQSFQHGEVFYNDQNFRIYSA